MFIEYLRRNMVEPAHAIYSKTDKLKYWKQLEKSQFLPQEKLKGIQWQRLKDIIAYVYKHNTFYRQRFEAAGFLPADLRTAQDLKKFPVLYKHEVRENTMQMLSDGYQADQLIQFKTGGSTGKPLQIYLTEACSEQRNALARRHDRWSGWEPGEAIGAAWGNPPQDDSMLKKIKRMLLEPYIFFDTMQVSDELVYRFAAQWQKVKPTLLFGHAHSIYVLAQYVEKLQIKTIRSRAIISSSMMLLPHERKYIERVFGIPVTNRYGCEEVSLIASECEQHNGMHLNIEHLYIEFLNDKGEDVKPGRTGKIVVTDLMNRAMPFIRYSVEDMAVPVDRPCSCGRGLPLIENVMGRTADFLVKKDGTRIAGISLIENTLTRIPGIAQMQIIQESKDEIRLNIVPDKLYNEKSSIEMTSYFNKLFALNNGTQINLAQEIKPEASGKFRFSISKVNPV